MRSAIRGRSRPSPSSQLYTTWIRGTPEPIRSALIDGAAWWADAFEAAGFIDAYRVEVLPEGVDPQDVRYNMIHWTHRADARILLR